MKGREILKKVVVSLLILSMSFSSVSVAAETPDGPGPIIEQSEETTDGEEATPAAPADEQEVPAPAEPSQTIEEETETIPGQDTATPPQTLPDGSQTEEDPVTDEEEPSEEDPSDVDQPVIDEEPADPSVTPVDPETQDPTETPEETGAETVTGEEGDALTQEDSEDPEEETEDGYIVLPASEENEYQMTPEELGDLEEDQVGYAAWQDQPRAAAYGMRRSSKRDASDNWSFDVNYTGEEGRDLLKTEDFHLKYQMEFHTSRRFLKDQIRIRVRRALLDKRDNKGPVNPSQIAAPYEDTDADGKKFVVESEDMPFAYRIEPGKDGVEYLEFFNYEDIEPGTNLMWQILYKDVKLMDIVDMSTWSLEPEITVYETKEETRTTGDGEDKVTETVTVADTENEVETRRPEPLTGTVDSYVELTGITKEAYKENDRSYTPELYTLEQLKKYATNIDPKFIITNADKTQTLNSAYRYVVWRVTMKGRANQPWTVRIYETPTLPGGTKGEIVGYKDNYNINQGYPTPIDPAAALTNSGKQAEKWPTNTGIIPARYKEDSTWSSRFYVVTAYPAGDVTPDRTELENTIQITAVPLDGKDNLKDQSKTASAKEIYNNYKWDYQGNTLTVDKRNPGNDATPYRGWLEVYRRLNGGAKAEDYGAIPFTISSSYRDYGYTHTTVQDENGTALGTYQNEKKYKLTTADDFMYAKVGDSMYPLSDKDYYFTDVTVRQTDIGWDVWEDQETKPESGEPLVISAMYEGKDEWETVASIPWDPSEDGKFKDGKFTYKFTDDDLARHPWRVKVEHETTGYATFCDIDVTVRIRGTSPVMRGNKNVPGWSKEGGNWQRKNDLPGILELYGGPRGNFSVEFLNLAGVIGERYDPMTKKWSPVRTISGDLTVGGSGNYSEPGLAEETGELYKDIVASYEDVARDNASRQVTGLDPWADSAKQLTETTNDVSKSRGQAVYSLTAHDGYRIYSEEAVADLKREGMPSPGRHKVAFYDLLPYGMSFDPSYTVRAGRITDLDTNQSYQKQPGLWDTNGVSVTWETKENYNNTGRTLVIFHLTYSDNADPAVYTRQNWLEGWGVSFRAYYDWKDRDLIKVNANRSAFMPDEKKEDLGYGEPLLGKSDELGCSNYSEDKNDNAFKEYEDLFGLNLNGDNSIVDVRNVLYAKNNEVGDLAVNSSSTLKKRVKADSYGSWQKTAAVEAGKTYTYEITVSADQNGLSDLILYDALENLASVQNNTTDLAGVAAANVWTGTFLSIDTKGLTDLGAYPVVYYSADEQAKRPDATKTGAEAFTSIENEDGSRVWYEQAEFDSLANKDLADVRSIAIDLRTKEDGTSYTLGGPGRTGTDQTGTTQTNTAQSLSFRIHMQAPGTVDENKPYAYNTSSYYSKFVAEGTRNDWRQGDYTKVRLAGTADLEVVKRFDTGKMSENLRESMKDTSFEFTLTRDGVPFEYKRYELYRMEGGNWKENPEPGEHYTDKDGLLYLKAEEKAVFKDVVDVKSVTVEETPNIFWESSEPEDTRKSVQKLNRTATAQESRLTETVTVTNTFRPVVYVRKTLESAPADHQKDTFKFQIRTNVNGTMESLKGSTFYYVDSVRTDGGIPRILTNPDGTRKTGKTSEKDGTFTIHAGEIIAIFPGQVGTDYEVKELDPGADWICQEPVAAGTASTSGTRAEIKNFYKWKELHLTKEITHQNAEECEEAFTFRIQRCEIVDGEERPRDLTPAEMNRINTAGINHTGIWLKDPKTGNPVPTAPGDTPIQIKADGLLGTGATTFTCHCAGKTIVIPMLEAGATYKITEIVQPDSNYLPLTDNVKVTMQFYGEKSERTIINDYQLRTLSVSKEVIGTTGANTNDEFTMEVKIGGEALANQPYQLMQDGNPVEGGKTTDWTSAASGGTSGENPAVGTYRTDTEGRIHIKDGMTAVFKDIARAGQSYAVRELVDEEKYMQLVPASGAGYAGTFAGSNLEAKFTNAENGSNLYIRKEYVAAENDTVAAGYVGCLGDLERNNESVPVEFHLTIKAPGMKDYTTPGLKCTRIDQLTGAESDAMISSGNISLKTGEVILVSKETILRNTKNWMVSPSGGNGKWSDDIEVTYAITEQPKFQHQLKTWSYLPGGSGRMMRPDLSQDYILSISQKTPANDQSFTGVVGQDSVATIVNEVRSMPAQYKILKEMTLDSDPVPENAQLTWYVERYNGYSWEPADGVSYVTAAGAWNMSKQQQAEIFTDDRIQTTGSDGLIRLYKLKKEDGERDRWPAVYFAEPVMLNAYEQWKSYNKGDLRVTEITGGQATHEKWGMLTGYRIPVGMGDGSTVTMTKTNYSQGSFINSNHTEQVVIRKEMPPETSECTETFTMQLKQVLSLMYDYDNDGAWQRLGENNIRASQGRAGIPYTLHDPESGSSSRTTGSGGAIYLKAGQYATLDLPKGTLWTVSEDQDYRYPLKVMKAEGDTAKLMRLNDNLMLIGQGSSSGSNGITIRYYDGDGSTLMYTDFIPTSTDPMESPIRGECWNGDVDEDNNLLATKTDGNGGYLVFVGWSYTPKAKEPDIEKDHEGSYRLPECTGDLDLYAVWKEAVRLELFDEQGIDEVNYVLKGSTYTPVKNDRRYGWSLIKGERATYPSNSIGPVNEDMTLYAVYRTMQSVKYTIVNEGGVQGASIKLRRYAEYGNSKSDSKWSIYPSKYDQVNPLSFSFAGSEMSTDSLTNVTLSLVFSTDRDGYSADIDWKCLNESKEFSIDKSTGAITYQSWPGEELEWELTITLHK